MKVQERPLALFALIFNREELRTTPNPSSERRGTNILPLVKGRLGGVEIKNGNKDCQSTDEAILKNLFSVKDSHGSMTFPILPKSSCKMWTWRGRDLANKLRGFTLCFVGNVIIKRISASLLRPADILLKKNPTTLTQNYMLQELDSAESFLRLC